MENKAMVRQSTKPIPMFATAYRRFMFWTGALAMGTLMTVVIVQIFCRYLLGFSLVWSEELSRAILVWITFGFAGLALDAGEVIAVDYLSEILPGRWRLIPVLFGSCLALAAVLAMVYYGYSYAAFNRGQVTAALQISQFWIYLAVPVGLGLFAIHLAIRIIQRIVWIWKSEPSEGLPA